jgi:hypothetical protein
MSEETPNKRKRGRPSHYTPDKAREICAHIAFGELSLTKLCQQPGMPQLQTVMDWLAAHDEFARQMAEARELRADKHRDKIEEIIEQVTTGKIDPQSGRVSIDGLKWLAGIEKPIKYGDRIRAEHTVRAVGFTETPSETQDWIRKALAAPIANATDVIQLLPAPEEPST